MVLVYGYDSLHVELKAIVREVDPELFRDPLRYRLTMKDANSHPSLVTFTQLKPLESLNSLKPPYDPQLTNTQPESSCPDPPDGHLQFENEEWLRVEIDYEFGNYSGTIKTNSKRFRAQGAHVSGNFGSGAYSGTFQVLGGGVSRWSTAFPIYRLSANITGKAYEAFFVTSSNNRTYYRDIEEDCEITIGNFEAGLIDEPNWYQSTNPSHPEYDNDYDEFHSPNSATDKHKCVVDFQVELMQDNEGELYYEVIGEMNSFTLNEPLIETQYGHVFRRSESFWAWLFERPLSWPGNSVADPIDGEFRAVEIPDSEESYPTTTDPCGNSPVVQQERVKYEDESSLFTRVLHGGGIKYRLRWEVPLGVTSIDELESLPEVTLNGDDAEIISNPSFGESTTGKIVEPVGPITTTETITNYDTSSPDVCDTQRSTYETAGIYAVRLLHEIEWGVRISDFRDVEVTIRPVSV